MHEIMGEEHESFEEKLDNIQQTNNKLDEL